MKMKLIYTLTAMVISIVLNCFGIPLEIIISVAGLFGITIVGHIITDIVSIIKGLQTTK